MQIKAGRKREETGRNTVISLQVANLTNKVAETFNSGDAGIIVGKNDLMGPTSTEPSIAQGSN